MTPENVQALARMIVTVTLSRPGQDFVIYAVPRRDMPRLLFELDIAVEVYFLAQQGFSAGSLPS